MKKSPILFLIFNRFENTKHVFSQIKLYKPEVLYIAADGPRDIIEEEKNICEKTRSYVISNIDWNCEVHTLFRDDNLGCGKAISQAIDWFFTHVEQGIILEDDCFPSLNFFEYAHVMLNKYKDSPSVMHISGVSILPESLKINNGYYYSVYPSIWGWATWRTSWNKYNFSMSNMVDFNSVNFSFKDFNQYIYWKERFGMVKNKMFDTWDYQWLFCLWLHNGISISPLNNLVTNIGFSKEANHTKNIKSIASKLPLETFSADLELHHVQNEYYDDFTFYRLYKEINVSSIKELKKIIKPFKNSILKKMLQNKYTFRDKLYILRKYLKSYLK
jgi:hypothetical protein